MGFGFISFYTFTALTSRRFKMKYILSMCEKLFITLSFINIIIFKATWLILSTISTFAVIWTNNFYLNMVLGFSLQACASVSVIATSLSADLFPTQYRYDIICIHWTGYNPRKYNF